MGEQLGLVVSLASLWPAAFEILAVKSYGAVHCWNRILDDNDPRFIATGDVIVAANGRTDPTAMIHELLHRRCVSLTLAKPRSRFTDKSPLSQRRSCDDPAHPMSDEAIEALDFLTRPSGDGAQVPENSHMNSTDAVYAPKGEQWSLAAYEEHMGAHHQTGEYLDNDHDETFASGVAAGNAPLNLGIWSDHDSGRAPQHTIDTQAESGVYDHSACNEDADPDVATLISADVQGFLNGGVDDEDEE